MIDITISIAFLEKYCIKYGNTDVWIPEKTNWVVTL